MEAQFFKNWPVTLNSFQGPSRAMLGRLRGGDLGTVILPNNAPARAEKWTLKQVQGDEDFFVGSFT